MMIRCKLSTLLADLNEHQPPEAQITQKELAETTELAPSTLWGLAKGRYRRIDYWTMDRLCEALTSYRAAQGRPGVTPGDLFEYIPGKRESMPNGRRKSQRGE